MKDIIQTVFGILIILGYGMNMYKLSQCNFEPKWNSEVIRSLGVVIFPMGVIAGYMEFDD